MTTNYVEKFAALFEMLKQNPAVEILKLGGEMTVNPEQSEYAYNDLRDTYGYELPEAFKEYVDISSGTHLRFVYRLRGRVAGGGEFHLHQLYDTLISEKDPELWNDRMSEDQISTLKTFRIFDDHPDSGDSKLAAFSKRRGVSPPRVPDIYFYDRGDYCKMNIDYGGYLDALLDLAGVSNWQYLFCNGDLRKPAMRHLSDSLKTTLGHLKAMFPQKDFSSYRRRLEGKS